MFDIDDQIDPLRARFALEGPTTTVPGLNREQIARVVCEHHAWDTDATGAVYHGTITVATSLQAAGEAMAMLGWIICSWSSSDRYTAIRWDLIPHDSAAAAAALRHAVAEVA